MGDLIAPPDTRGGPDWGGRRSVRPRPGRQTKVTSGGTTPQATRHKPAGCRGSGWAWRMVRRDSRGKLLV